MLLTVLLGLFRSHLPLLLQVTFISKHTDQNRVIRIALELLKPGTDILKTFKLSDIINHERPYRTPIISIRYRPEPLLTCRVPYLRFHDCLVLCLYCLRRELDADCRLQLDVELAVNKAGEDVALAHSGVTYQHQFEQ